MVKVIGWAVVLCEMIFITMWLVKGTVIDTYQNRNLVYLHILVLYVHRQLGAVCAIPPPSL